MAYLAELDRDTYRIDVHATGDSAFAVEIDGVTRTVDSRRIGQTTYSLLIDGRSVVAEVSIDDDRFTVTIGGEVFHLELADERRRRVKLGEPEEEKGRREVRAQMPGKVVEVLVGVGDRVVRDQAVLIIEAMKMQNEVKSPVAGEVKEILVVAGQAVESRQLLAVVE
ncbi:MAG: biotin/lipoyl-containing protein [Candidatus Binatia bacterium]